MSNTPATPDLPPNRRIERRFWLRPTLRRSQQEALAASAMTATSDNFFNAFAIFLQASMSQLGLLTGLPQLIGAIMQFSAIWLGNIFTRKNIIVITAVIQGLGLLAMSLLGIIRPQNSVWLFIGLATLHHGLLNLILPHWRAWMGNLVPPRRRGSFFAARTRITMLASLVVFLLGGALLTLTDTYQAAWVGFTVLFLMASAGRFISAWLLWKMHDPVVSGDSKPVGRTWHRFIHAWRDPVFRHYSLFVALMQSAVAISAPFFAVYMLNDLQFSYFQFVLSGVASIATQFITLPFWGKFSDRFGNRLVMVVTCSMISFLPLMWLFSTDFVYILIVQMISGLWWSGFTLSTANYLYDIRPHHADFATYAAMQAGLGAGMVFAGSIFGGVVASYASEFHSWSGLSNVLYSALFIVFITSSLGRLAVCFWFIPRLKEPSTRRRPSMLNLVFRISRFNAISGVNLDWMTVTKKRKTEKSQQQKQD